MDSRHSVSRSINASPAAVFAAITDITRMGEWSPETVSAEWSDGFDTAAVGAEFTGINRHGDKEWTTYARITELEADSVFNFDCFVGEFTFARWGYAIEATDSGCTVTEHTEDLRPEEFLEASVKISGVSDRLTHNRAGMEQTLANLAAAVE